MFYTTKKHIVILLLLATVLGTRLELAGLDVIASIKCIKAMGTVKMAALENG